MLPQGFLHCHVSEDVSGAFWVEIGAFSRRLHPGIKQRSWPCLHVQPSVQPIIFSVENKERQD